MMRCSVIGALLAGLWAFGVQAGPDHLVRPCLQTLRGIELRMPYAPHVAPHRCAAPGAAWGMEAPGDGSTVLELVGSGGLPHDARPGIEWTDREAAMHQAVYLHFRKLFARQGFVVAEELPVGRNPGYVGTARFERSHDGRIQTLRYETIGANMWRLTFKP